MTVALDSNVLIYWLDGVSDFHKESTGLLTKLLKQNNELVCSTLVATEVTAWPNIPSSIVNDFPVSWQDVSLPIAQHAGMLRQKHKIGLQDAIHLASASAAGAKEFYTNDLQLTKLRSIDSLQIKPLA